MQCSDGMNYAPKGKPAPVVKPGEFVFAAVGLLYVLPDLAAPSLYTLSRLGVFLAIPLLLRYNGSHGARSRALQYGFYWFYPLHLLLLWLIRVFLLRA